MCRPTELYYEGTQLTFLADKISNLKVVFLQFESGMTFYRVCTRFALILFIKYWKILKSDDIMLYY